MMSALLGDLAQIEAIAVLVVFVGDPQQLPPIDKTAAEGDLLGATDLQALAFFYGADELAGLQQGFVRAGIEPGKTAAQQLDRQIAPLEIEIVEGGDFQFAAGRGLEGFGELRRPSVIKIK